MLRIAVFAAVLVAALCVPFMDEAPFEVYMMHYDKMYTQEEKVMRSAIYNYNVGLIRKHNMEYMAGRHTFTMGVNEYADWTTAEFSHFMNGFRMNKFSPLSSVVYMNNTVEALPKSVDWRTKGYVTPIKDQKDCGSCWAFSATGSLEGQHFKQTGKLVSLSEQNLVDCSGPEGNMGCEGGLMDQAFEYIKLNKGIDTEMSYPYTAEDGTCHFKSVNVGATDTGFVDIKHMDEKALQNAVAMVGPVSVAIDASLPSFHMYKSGIYSDPECSQTALDHGVLAVGYSSESGQDYWIVKNSWGTSWGMKGYIKMARNMDNMCGIATEASYPTV